VVDSWTLVDVSGAVEVDVEASGGVADTEAAVKEVDEVPPPAHADRTSAVMKMFEACLTSNSLAQSSA
jgi:hypothetical protein